MIMNSPGADVAVPSKGLARTGFFPNTKTNRFCLTRIKGLKGKLSRLKGLNVKANRHGCGSNDPQVLHIDEQVTVPFSHGHAKAWKG